MKGNASQRIGACFWVRRGRVRHRAPFLRGPFAFGDEGPSDSLSRTGCWGQMQMGSRAPASAGCTRPPCALDRCTQSVPSLCKGEVQGTGEQLPGWGLGWAWQVGTQAERTQGMRARTSTGAAGRGGDARGTSAHPRGTRWGESRW